MVPLSEAASTVSHSGAWWLFSVSLASLKGSRLRRLSRTSMRSPGFSWNDGMLVGRPLTAK